MAKKKGVKKEPGKDMYKKLERRYKHCCESRAEEKKKVERLSKKLSTEIENQLDKEGRVTDLEKALKALISETETSMRREEDARKLRERYFRALHETLETGIAYNEQTSLTEIAKHQGRMLMAKEGLRFFGEPINSRGPREIRSTYGSCMNQVQAVLDGKHWKEMTGDQFGGEAFGRSY